MRSTPINPAYPITIFTPKELGVIIGKFYNVPLRDETPPNSTVRKFFIKHESSALTAEMIVALLRNIDRVVELPADFQKDIIEKNEIKTAGSLYAINSPHMIEFVAENIFGSKENVASGRYGNVSKAYLSPRHSDVFSSRREILGLKKNFKLVSASQLKILTSATAYLLFERDEGTDVIGISLNRLSIESTNQAISAYMSDGYTPVRLLFNEITAGEANIFNVGTVHDLLVVEIEAKISKYFQVENMVMRSFSNATLRSSYGVDMSDYMDGPVGNTSFRCHIDDDGRLRSIYLIEKEALYFAKPSYDRGAVQFDRTSTVKNFLRTKDFLTDIQAENKDGTTYQVNLKWLAVDAILARINDNNFGQSNSLRSGSTRMDCYEHLLAHLSPKISLCIEKTHATSLFTSDHGDDQLLRQHIKRLARDPRAYFDVMGFHSSETGLDDEFIQFRDSAQIGASIRVRERNASAASNDNRAVFYANMHKSNLSFEREKMLTVMFVCAAITWLRENGHTGILVELEEPVAKHGGGRGYLDCIVTSEKADVRYGQVFEFKAWSRFHSQQQILKTQCATYDVSSLINARHVTRTYTCGNVLDVVGVNLRLDGVESLAASHTPWNVEGKWPSALFIGRPQKKSCRTGTPISVATSAC